MADNIEGRLGKIEDKLDKLTELLEKFARIEERQVSSRRDIEELKQKLHSAEIKIAQSLWIERAGWMVLAAGVGWFMKHV